MKYLEEEIKTLESLKHRWYEKENELFDHVKSYEGGNDAEYIKEFQKKLDTICDELRSIGREYHKEVYKIADDITNNHKDDPIIKILMDGFKSDVDNNWNLYHGNREARLKDLVEIIEMFDKMS